MNRNTSHGSNHRLAIVLFSVIAVAFVWRKRSFHLWLAIVTFAVCGGVAEAEIISNGQPNVNYDGGGAVGDDLLLWLRGDLGFTAGANTDWLDQSNSGFTFRQTVVASQPSQNLAGLGGQATIDFDGGDHLAKLAGTLTGYQTTFIVYRDTSTAQWVSPIGSIYNPGAGNNGSSYHGQVNDSGIFNVSNTDIKTLNGQNYRNGADIGNGTTTPRPDSYVIDAHIATGPLGGEVLFVGSAECCGNPPGGRKIIGGIAEILMYDRALTNDGSNDPVTNEFNAVGWYLQERYNINGSFLPPPIPEPSTLTLAALGLLGLMGFRRRRRR